MTRSKETFDKIDAAYHALQSALAQLHQGPLRSTERVRLSDSPLTPREQEIMWAVAEGRSNKDIAALLSLSGHTVRNHIFHIYEKLGFSNRVELTLYAMSRPQKEQS